MLDRARKPAFATSQAVALGLLQGPTELLPVSSSAHTALLPWLAGWRYAELDPELRKSFEVALHAGAGLALAIDMRGELLEEALRSTARRAATIACSLAPPAIAGYALRRSIERRLGGPRSIAAGLIAGAVAMALADAAARARARRCERRRPARRAGARPRPGGRADPRGLAQRSDAHRGAGAGVRARGRAGALLARRPAGDPRGERAGGRAAGPRRAAARRAPALAAGAGVGLRLDARERARAAPGAAAGARCCPARSTAARSRWW